MPTIRCLLLLAAVCMLSGCQQGDVLPDALYFAPGTPVQYQGKSGKLYGTDQCSQGRLSGYSCLIFLPHRPSATAVIIVGQRVQQINVTAKRDPKDPMQFVVVDNQGFRLLTASDNDENKADIKIAY